LLGGIITLITGGDVNAYWAQQYAAMGLYAEGGIATRPTPGVFGEAGAEALIPLEKMDEFGGGQAQLDEQRKTNALLTTIVSQTKRSGIGRREFG